MTWRRLVREDSAMLHEVWPGTLEGMSQKKVDHVFIVTVLSLGGLTVGNVIGGLFGGIPLMIIAGLLAHRHIDKL